MKLHTTNYKDTFIEVAEDCRVTLGVIPQKKGNQPILASLQFDMLIANPYKYTSDDVLFMVFAIRKGLPENEWKEQRVVFFSKGQPCFRASPLTKSFGWGVHSNEDGKTALYGMESEEYSELVADASVKKLKAMRSKRK